MCVETVAPHVKVEFVNSNGGKVGSLLLLVGLDLMGLVARRKRR